VYIRDTGLLHALLGLETQNELLGHPVYGGSWESFAIENILSFFPAWNSFFFRTSSGNEIDLILERGGRRIAVEFKASTAPRVGKRFWNALNDLENPDAWIIAPVKDAYPVKENVTVSPLGDFINHMQKNGFI
jgi:predicted AAA+ superfamily ATPase